MKGGPGVLLSEATRNTETPPVIDSVSIAFIPPIAISDTLLFYIFFEIIQHVE